MRMLCIYIIDSKLLIVCWMQKQLE